MSISDLMDIKDHHLVDARGRLTRIYSISGFHVSHYTQVEYESYIEAIKQVLNSLTSVFSLQIIKTNSIEYSDPFFQKKSVSDIQTLIYDDFNKSVKKYPYFKKTTYLVVTYNPETKFDFLGREKQLQLTHDEQINELDKCETTHLVKLKHALTQLKNEDIYKLCFYILNPKKYRLALPEYREDVYLSDLIFNSTINNTSDFVELDGAVCMTLNLCLLPTHADLKFISNLEFDANTIVSFNFQKANQDSEITRLTLKRNVIGSTSGMVQDMIGLKNSGSEELKSEQTTHEISDVIEEISLGKQELFKLSVSICVISDTYEDCKLKIQDIESKLQSINKMVVKKDKYNHLDNLISCLPSQGYKNKKQHLVLTDALAVLVPLNGIFNGTTHEEIVLRSLNNERVGLSLYKSELSSSHGIILAPTGKGKSFTVNYILQQLALNTHTHISIVDRGGSYKKLCLLNNGDYISVDLDKKYAINCMPKTSEFIVNEEEIDKNKLVFLRQFILLAVADEIETKIAASQEQVLEKSISSFYKQTSLDEPVLGDYVKFLEAYNQGLNEPFIDLIRRGMLFFCEKDSAYEILLNKKSSLSIQNSFLVFDITKFKEHPRLERLYFFLINKILNDKMMNLVKQNKQQIVVFDEAWKVLSSQYGAQMVETLYREARRYGTKIFCISHSGRDFTENEFTTIIPLNSEIKIILSHDKDKLTQLDNLGLNTTDLNWISSMQERRDVFIKFGLNRCVVSLNASPLMNEICRTDAESINKYQNLVHKDELIRELKTCDQD